MRLARNLGWWIADYAYAGWWQLRAALDRTDPADFATGERTPIVVLPGVYETWRFLQPLVRALHARGHPVHVITALRHNRESVTAAARHVSDYLQRHDLHDVVLVAHSKGGLIGKQLLTVEPTRDRVRTMVAVATPFAGSLYGRLMPLPTLREFSPRDATILALGQAAQANSRIVSVFPRFDPHIPEGSELVGATNVVLETGGHFRVLAHPRVIGEAAAAAE